MPAGEHELVAVGMLRPAIVEPQSAERRARQVRGHVVRRIGQRPAEVPGLRVVAEQDQCHRCQEADILQALPVVGRRQPFERGDPRLCTSSQSSNLLVVHEQPAWHSVTAGAAGPTAGRSETGYGIRDPGAGHAGRDARLGIPDDPNP